MTQPAYEAFDSSYIVDREISRQERLEGLDLSVWLRSTNYVDNGDFAGTKITKVSPNVRTDFVIDPPKLISPKVTNFVSEQSFEGTVLSVDLDNKTFWARLIDCSGSCPDEEAEFPLSEVPGDDLPLIVPGALFTWNIGPEWRNGQMRRVSDFRFRRFFKFTSENVVRAKERAEALATLISESNAYPTEDSTKQR